MIMVDELVTYYQAPKAGAARHFGHGKESCHLTTDGPLDELHAFAARLGLQRAWFQPGSTPHYDLTPNKRAQALQLGAVFVPGLDQARARIAARKARTTEAPHA
jgi:hypothetical protein